MNLLKCTVIHFIDDKKISYILPETLRISTKEVDMKPEHKIAWIPLKELFLENKITKAECFEGTSSTVTFINSFETSIPWDSDSDTYIIGNFIFKK